jgi:hypothetical protein
MNAPAFLELRPAPPDDGQRALPLATQGIQRYVWDSRFGSILIEVVGDQTFVNGVRVEPAPA